MQRGNPATRQSGDTRIRFAGIRGVAGFRWALAITGFALGVATPTLAPAQQVAPSRVTPETLQPQAPSTPQITLPAAAGLTPPANADKLFVRVGRVDVTGTFPGFEDKTAALLSPLNGSRVTVAHLYDVANDLEHAYAQAGYFLARIVIPPQGLSDGGTLHLTVIDGVIEKIDANSVPERQRPLVEARLAPIIGLHHVTLDDIERRLLIVSDLPGLQVRSTLSPGSNTGGTLLVLQGSQTYASGTLGFDNHLPESLGTWALNASVALNNVLGWGEQSYLSIASSPDLGPARLRVLGGGFALPLGTDGLTINPEYTKSLARPIPVAGSPATQGDFERFAVRANYPVIRSRDENLSLQGSLEWNNEQLRPIGFSARFYDDEYAVGRLRAVYTTSLDPETPVQVTGTLSRGLGGRNATDELPLSRQGAGPSFTSAQLVASLQHPLPASLFLSITGRAQTSFNNPLMLAEQFALDGGSALSAFADGSFSVDQGATLRIEISRPLSLPVGDRAIGLSPYVFGAGGWGELVTPTAVEQRDIGAGAVGIGVRTDASVPGWAGGTLVFEFAHKFSDVRTIPDGYRANLSVNLRF
ncbi:MAG TPA: ShlB/FhaC/HecB family hemolysin secretion/activation protein [Stellaceae bacterium]|nr:ShlB/FhaC/HecB family hemolysin secretion/activation protein [Stellaceae bacterium]